MDSFVINYNKATINSLLNSNYCYNLEHFLCAKPCVKFFINILFNPGSNSYKSAAGGLEEDFSSWL